MRVRIKKAPREADMDGVELGRFTPGTVRDVSPTLGSWLIVQGYAQPEMRGSEHDEETRQLSGGRRESDRAANWHRKRRF